MRSWMHEPYGGGSEAGGLETERAHVER